MARCVDGFVIPVPKRNVQAYRRMAQQAGKIWRKYGALEFLECVGDDLKAKGIVPFTRAARAKPGEIAKMMEGKAMPFDAKRMVYGGFRALVDL